MFEVRQSRKQQYDDNNYFDVTYISSVMGEEVSWGSYEIEILEETIAKIKSLYPSNSLNFITDRDMPVMSDILKIKEEDFVKYYPEIVDICVKCLTKRLSLDSLLEEVKSRDIY